MAKAPAKAAGKAGKAAGKKKSFKKKEKRVVHNGLVHVQATFNNTIVTISDQEGNVISWSSAGSLGFRGSRKGTPFAAQQAASNAASMARDHGVRSVDDLGDALEERHELLQRHRSVGLQPVAEGVAVHQLRNFVSVF